jgi:hypothetical protein
VIDLESIELIKQLKARYFRSIDTCDLKTLEQVFTPDAWIHYRSPTYDIRHEGWKAELEGFFRLGFTETKFGMHHGHMPEITVNGDTATGLWYLQDIFYNLEVMKICEGTALYEDEYVRRDGEWRIRSSYYERLLEVVRPLPKELRFTSKPIGKGPGHRK